MLLALNLTISLALMASPLSLLFTNQTAISNKNGLLFDWYKPVAVILSPISNEGLIQDVATNKNKQQMPYNCTFTPLFFY